MDSTDELNELAQEIIRQPEEEFTAMLAAAVLRAHNEHSYERGFPVLLHAFGHGFSGESSRGIVERG